MPRLPTRSTLVLALLALPLAAVPAAAQEPARPLAALSFMAGCWRGDGGTDQTIEEQWTAADSDMMLAATRYLDDNDNRTRGWEFSRIVADSSGITLLPAPRGNQQGRFRMTESSAGIARFEDPSHDFPKRIIYRRIDARTLGVRIDGGEGDERGQEFRLQTVACPAPR
jgi:hypothetical protein